MSPLGWILTLSFAGGVLSVIAAALIGLGTRASAVPHLISYAIGALLGAVFLEILPHAIENAQNVHNLAATVLGGILLFFILEKLVLWRHCHGHATGHDCEAHEPALASHGHGHDHGRSGLLILIGDTFHNFVDGILIAAAFLENPSVGLVTAFAIIAHEIPQELGDFVVLIHSGYSRTKALLFNVLSGVATMIGALLAYYALSSVQEWVPSLLALAAASMLYVAVADLIPGLHRRPEIKATVQQVLLIGAGIGSIALVRIFVDHG
ncbi:zinc and cadmium transporter [Oryzomicrobium terrae]|uniref:Zinc and cadmium transporter n=1 Tax=Oryzomicrobium terrae TaxID=1735038 RepID=A0A5C1E7X5_9RHOO|nr:ZIP family metal transporter [Oryzomicrobium terrae]QEL64699.1 zinc and cadmium transporter [Oryzomicrobium terrae]